MDEPAVSPERLAEAFRRAYEEAGLSQAALSEATGIDQSLISKYARGAVTPPLAVLPLVDAACGRPRGYVLRLAGYVSDEVDVAAAILTDPALDEDGRTIVLNTYRLSVKFAEALRTPLPDDPGPPSPAIVELEKLQQRDISADARAEIGKLIHILRNLKADSPADAMGA